MGNEHSSSAGLDDATIQQQRISELGTRFPFSDKELEILFRCHSNRLSKRIRRGHSTQFTRDEQHRSPQEKYLPPDGFENADNNASFLLDLSLCSIRLPTRCTQTVTCSQRRANSFSEWGLGWLDSVTSSTDETKACAEEKLPAMKQRRNTIAHLETRKTNKLSSSYRNSISEWGWGWLDVVHSSFEEIENAAEAEKKQIYEDHSLSHSKKDPLATNDSLCEETRVLMDTIEQQILPRQFGNRLEKVVFQFSWEDQIKRTQMHSFDHLADHTKKYIDDKVSVEVDFLDGLTRCLGRRGSRSSLEIIFACCCDDKRSTSSMARAHDLVTLGFRLALASYFLAENGFSNADTKTEISDSSLAELSRSLLQASRQSQGSSSPCNDPQNEQCSPEYASEMVSRSVFIEWAESTVPHLSAVLPTFIHHLIFRNIPFSPSRQPFLFPKIDEQSSVFFTSKFSPRLFSYACMSFSLGGRWHRLYTTELDGLSFNRLRLALVGYAGPTLMIVSASSGGVFGAFSSDPWKESKEFYGTSDCFLYQLEPLTGVFRPGGMERNFMYCNPESRSKGYDGLAHGIGFGGTSQKPRLFIPESFEGCIAGSRDVSFEPGALLPIVDNGTDENYFEIESLEVWGVGGDEIIGHALAAQGKERETTAAKIRNAKKGDVASCWEDSGLARKVREDLERGGRVDMDKLRADRETKE